MPSRKSPSRKPTIRLLAVVVSVALVAGLTAAVVNRMHTSEVTDETASVWFCPMHTHVQSAHEGSCPICGMNLVRKPASTVEPHTGSVHEGHEGHESHEGHEGSTYAAPMHDDPAHQGQGHEKQAHEEPGHEHTAYEHQEYEDQFHVAAEVRQRMGVTVEAVELLDFRPSLRVAAQVIADEQRAVSLSPKVEGWIKRLGVSVVGQPIRAGQVLFEIYSPELQQRQRDYLALLARRDALLAAQGGGMVGNSAPDLMLASVARERFRSRARLAAADVPEVVLRDLEKIRRVHDVVAVLAEHDGVITSIGARQGAYVSPAQTVVSYADLSDPWAELSINPELLAVIRRGDEIEMRSTVDATVKASARIDTSLAVVDPVSRTARVRVRLAGAGRNFPPGTLLDARIHLSTRKALTVVSDAVIHTGQGDFVIVAEAAGHFRQAPIRLGAESGERVEVVDGLSPGQKVVTNGQFLLSAEASLQASRQRFSSVSQDHNGH